MKKSRQPAVIVIPRLGHNAAILLFPSNITIKLITNLVIVIRLVLANILIHGIYGVFMSKKEYGEASRHEEATTHARRPQIDSLCGPNARWVGGCLLEESPTKSLFNKQAS